jgi:hypothetical protein
MAVLDPVALAKGGAGSVRVMFCVKRFVTVEVIVIVVSGPEGKLKEEVEPAVVLVRVVDVELTKKAPGSAVSAATLVTEVRAVLRVTGCVAVTKVVISGLEGVVAVVMFELAVAVLFGKKAPGELAATVLFEKKGILKVVELKRLDVVNDWKGPFTETLGKGKLEEVRFEEVIEVKTVVAEVTVLLGKKTVVV